MKRPPDAREGLLLPDGTQARQLPLFVPAAPGRGRRDALSPPPLAPYPGQLTADSSLDLALTWFGDEMARSGYAEHTRAIYAKDAARLLQYFGRGCRLRDISPGGLRQFHAWVLTQPRSAKTKELTISAVRAFFKALASARVLPGNPAENVYPTKAHSPLSAVLYDADVAALRGAASEIASRDEDPDPLPALLLTLFLDLGLRLGEAVTLAIADVDLSNPGRPVVHVRYEERRHCNKQRSLAGNAALAALLRSYVERYVPEGPRLFPWTGRHVQNVVGALGERAGLRQQVNPNVLRWTFAFRQWQAKVPEDTLRQRLGLSRMGWEDTKRKLRALARELEPA
jgi:site-specific recombinase XerD